MEGGSLPGFGSVGGVGSAFLDVAASRPGAAAILSPNGAVSYAALENHVCECAGGLLEAGVEPEGRALILAGDPAGTIAGMIACLCLGITYVVLDPALPEARLQRIAEDAAAGAILADEKDLFRCQELFPTVPVAIPGPRISPGGLRVKAAAIPATAHAYIAYTSGTTGRPKGVVHTQANIWHEVRAHTASLALRADDRFSALYSPAVIGAVRDLFGSLLNGATLCPFPFRERGFRVLADWLKASRVTQYHSVPVLFRELVRVLDPGESLPDVRVVFLAGDVVTPADVALARRHTGPSCRFYTGIGASEATSIYTHWFVPNDWTPGEGTRPAGSADWDLPRGKLPTGLPIQDKEVRLIDRESGRPVGRGEIGEIEVSSRYLSVGYWRQDELTRAAFSEGQDGQRTYRTGDLGRFDHEGRLWHLGRADRQTKIRGVRIELEEVETALRELPKVRRAAVRVWPGHATEPRLVAYLEAESENGAPDPTNFRAMLGRLLPDAAVPSDFIFLERLPLLGNLKIDLQALPEPPPKPTGGVPARENHLDPADRPVTSGNSGLIDVVLEAFAAALEQPPATILPGVDFRAQGGDSLGMMRLTLELERRLGRPVRIFFDAPLTAVEIARRFGVAAPREPATVSLIRRQAEAIAASWSLPEGSARHATEPAVCFKGPGGNGGSCLVWLAHVGSELEFCSFAAAERPVVALPSGFRVIRGDAASIGAWISELADSVTEILGPAPLVFGGTCSSGILAALLASEWMRRGHAVEGVLLLDAFGSRWSRTVARRLLLPWLRWIKPTIGIGWRAKIGHLRWRVGVTKSLARLRRTACLPNLDDGFLSAQVPAFKVPLVLVASHQAIKARWLIPRLGWSVARHPGLRLVPVPGDHSAILARERWDQFVQLLREIGGMEKRESPGAGPGLK